MKAWQKTKTFWIIWGMILISILWCEGLFRILVGYSLFSLESIQILLFSITISMILAGIYQYLPILMSKVLFLCTILCLGIYTLLQLNFKSFMGNFMSLSAASEGGIGRVTTEIASFVRAIHPIYWLVFIPFIVFLIILIVKKGIYQKKDISIKSIAFTLLIILVFHFGSIAFLKIDSKTQIRSNEQLYKHPTLIEVSLQKFGVTRFLWRDFINMIFPVEDEIIDITPPVIDPSLPEPEPDFKRHIDDSDWLTMIEQEKDSTIKNIHEFLMNQPITPKNEMTGIFKDKNLILVMVEAFDLSAIDKNLTPTLYKLQQEGWFFDHYYTPKYSCTTGESEFIGEMSIIPSLTNCTPNTYVDNNYATSIFQIFKQNQYYTTSYHSWRDQFYERTKLHANMGSQQYYDYDRLKMGIPNGWPSDEQLFEKAYPYFKNENNDNFFSFVITASMHFPYDEDSTISQRYWNQVQGLNASDKMKRYWTKAIDLDHGLQYLLEQLEKDGTLDDTVIVLFGDHHPLNMGLDNLNAFSPVDRYTDFNEDRMPFIIYNHGQEAKVISKTASTFDILPTLANLFDLEYDPRYYIGKDLFSNEETIVIFPNGSWITDKAMYFSNKGSYKSQGEPVTDDYIKSINQKVNNYFTISNRILTKNYFQYRFPQ